MRTIPLIPARFAVGLSTAGHALGHNGTTWAIYELDGAEPKVRDLNSYEARFVNSVQDFMAEKAVKDLQQIRRDLTAAREATARVHSEWRGALGANTGDNLVESTRFSALELQAMHRRAGNLRDRAEYFAEPGLREWDAVSYGQARGLQLAAHIMTDRPFNLPAAPSVWGSELGTLRGQYKLHRSAGYSVLGSAVRAFFGGVPNETPAA